MIQRAVELEAGGMSGREIGHIIGKSRNAVIGNLWRRRQQPKALRRAERTRRHWTELDDANLETWFSYGAPMEAIIVRLERIERAITRRVVEKDLKKQPYIPPRQKTSGVCRIFGCYHTAQPGGICAEHIRERIPVKRRDRMAAEICV